MKNQKQQAMALVEQFKNIAARADRIWCETGIELYLKIRDEADKHVTDIIEKLQTGHTNKEE